MAGGQRAWRLWQGAWIWAHRCVIEVEGPRWGEAAVLPSDAGRMPSPTVALQRSRGSRQQRQRNVEATCGARDALRRPRMMDSHIFSPETCAAARLCGVGSVRSLSFVSCCRVESGRYRIAHANSEQGRAERAVRCRDSCVFFAESVERGGNNWKVHCDCPLPFQSQTARMGSGPGGPARRV